MSSLQDSNLTLQQFKVLVDVAGVASNLPFAELSGLDSASGYRTRLSALARYAPVTLRRGLLKRDQRIIDWLSSVYRGTTTRATVTVKLVDAAGRPAFTWTLSNAWPSKVESANLNATGTDVAVETLELTYEGLTMTSG